MGNAPSYKSKEEYEQSLASCDARKNSFFGGQRALGDPDDKRLAKKEKSHGLPAKRREIIIEEHCSKPHLAYLECHERHKYLGRFRCRNDTLARSQCLREFWDLPGLEERAKNEYLAARSFYRRTGESQVEKPKLFNLLPKQKTWEEYQQSRDKNPWIELKDDILTIFRMKKPPDISVQRENEHLDDT